MSINFPRQMNVYTRFAQHSLRLWEHLYGCQLLREILHQSTKLSDIWLLEKLLPFFYASRARGATSGLLFEYSLEASLNRHI